MPGEIIGETLVESLKLVGRVLWEVAFELAIKGTGYVICRMFKRKVDPEGASVALVGLAFWIAIGGIGYMVWH